MYETALAETDHKQTIIELCNTELDHLFTSIESLYKVLTPIIVARPEKLEIPKEVGKNQLQDIELRLRVANIKLDNLINEVEL